MKFTLIVLAVVLASILLVFSNTFLGQIDWAIHPHPFIDKILKYQIFALLLAAIAVWLTLKITPESKALLRWGNTGVSVTKERWLGISGRKSWAIEGSQLLIFISAATGLFMYFAVKNSGQGAPFQWAFVPFILLFSATNAFTEEMLYRFVINGNLTASVSKMTILITSAVLFGLPHYYGFPTGIIGVIMAGVLGYVLSKATYETQGLGLAWGMHFVQDVIIFTGLVMMQPPVPN